MPVVRAGCRPAGSPLPRPFWLRHKGVEPPVAERRGYLKLTCFQLTLVVLQQAVDTKIRWGETREHFQCLDNPDGGAVGPGIFASAFTQPLREEGAPIRMTDRPPRLSSSTGQRVDFKGRKTARLCRSGLTLCWAAGRRRPCARRQMDPQRAITPSCPCAATTPSAISSWIWWRSSPSSCGCGGRDGPGGGGTPWARPKALAPPGPGGGGGGTPWARPTPTSMRTRSSPRCA